MRRFRPDRHRGAGLPVIVALFATACGDGRLEFHFSATDGTPLSGIEVQALPFDAQRLLDSLAGTAAEPMPTFPALEQAIRDYAPTDDDAVSRINAPWYALRDTVQGLSDSLHGLDPSAPTYGAAYDRFRTLYARFTRATATRDQALRAEGGGIAQLARWAQAAADTLRAWERAAFAASDSIASIAILSTAREPRSGDTGPAGELRLSLEPGAWWVVARLPDPDNPFLEYYWNVPVQVNGIVPVVLRVSTEQAVRRWRH